jgi:hypothetical protein
VSESARVPHAVGVGQTVAAGGEKVATTVAAARDAHSRGALEACVALPVPHAASALGREIGTVRGIAGRR